MNEVPEEAWNVIELAESFGCVVRKNAINGR